MYAEIESIEADQRRFRIWLAALILGLLLLPFAGWFGRSAYPHFKEKREQSHNCGI
jgi:hypothetical protein